MVYLDNIEGQAQPQPQYLDPYTLRKLILVASVAAGVQFGWAVQLSLLTPYTQLLGLSHQSVSLIWLCGPITGLLVQPIIGHHSDRCTSIYGRRRPFLVSGTILLCLGGVLIGYAADIGRAMGEKPTAGHLKLITIQVFVLGFWLLDIANNMIQSPCRALLADLSEGSDALVTIGNALFAFFMSIGNVTGYGAGALASLHSILPFTITDSCDQNCANLKTCFIISGAVTSFIVTLVAIFIKEETLDPMCLGYWKEQQSSSVQEKPPSFFKQIGAAAKSTTPPIRSLYMVTALNWIGLFPFLLYATDWMGKEVYGGDAVGSAEEVHLYNMGMRTGALGLLFYVLTMGGVSLFMEPLLTLFGGVNKMWSYCNFILAFCMAGTVAISHAAVQERKGMAGPGPPHASIKISCFALFAALGIPQAVTYSIPFALASIYSKDTGTGQGLALGLLNLAIVVPQIAVALISGPMDSVFHNSNLPAFIWGGLGAVAAGFAARNLPLTE